MDSLYKRPLVHARNQDGWSDKVISTLPSIKILTIKRRDCIAQRRKIERLDEEFSGIRIRLLEILKGIR